MTDNRPLKVKALEAAINAIKTARTRKQANRYYLINKEAFGDNDLFKKAIQDKIKEFNIIKAK